MNKLRLLPLTCPYNIINLMQICDLIINLYIRIPFFMIRVVPAGFDPGVVAATDVAGERISHDQYLVFFHQIDISKHSFEKLHVWFFHAYRFGQKDAVHQFSQAGKTQFFLLSNHRSV